MSSVSSGNPGFSLDVGGVRVDPACVLAPMEGITDRPLRTLIRSLGGCGLTMTEFVSSEAMTRNVARAWRTAELDPSERPVSVQIYGRDPARMADAARACQDLGADLVDLNLGCPSKTVTSGRAGAALMRDPLQAVLIFRAVRAALTVPMTVKMRLGWDRETQNAPEIARYAQEEGAALIAVHGRTRMCAYRGQADWGAVGAVKDAVAVPVLVNGDILTVEDAAEALRQSGADGVMIGRGALRDPWLLRRIAEHQAGLEPYSPTLAERRRGLLRYFDLLVSSAGIEEGKAAGRSADATARRALGKMKKITGYFTRGLPYGARLREQVFRARDIATVHDAVDAFFVALADENLREGFARVFADPSSNERFNPGDPRRLERPG